MIIYEPLADESIECAAKNMVCLANTKNQEINADFNGVTLRAFGMTDPAFIVADYNIESERRHKSRQHSR